MKKSLKSFWNYRVITKLENYSGGDSYQEFSIAEVHYRNGKPESYANKFILQSFLSLKELKWTNKKIKKAFKKPVLDVDNKLKKWK
jgi:hypothetical protein